MKKFNDELDLEAYYDEQKKVLVEKLELQNSTDKAALEYKAALTKLMEFYNKEKLRLIEQQLAKTKKDLAQKAGKK